MNTEVMFSKESDKWATPLDLFNRLNNVFEFTCDPCAMPDNRLGLPKFWTEETDGLSQIWKRETLFINPPYSETGKWLKHMAEAFEYEGCTGLVLIPVRTDTKYWHEYVANHATSILFIKGRLKFGDAKSGAPFPSCLVSYGLDINRVKELGHVCKA